MSFGKRMRESRSNKKLTQAEVAKILGIDDTTISKYENDKSEPDNETIKKMAALYNVSVGYLIGNEESEKPIISDLELSDDELISKYNVVLDGKPIEESILREILSYVRVRRSTK